MSADGAVISLAERLKQRREELGLSQSQAARELDVARTAYRLWELEAAKPAPDRWRLIARWLGVSVTTMLLAEDLVSQDEAAMSELAAVDFGRSGKDWDEAAAAQVGGFFAQARALIADGSAAGALSADQARMLASLVERIEQQRPETSTVSWEPTELRKTLAANDLAPGAAREAVSFVGGDLPREVLENARLLASELVTNSVQHGPQTPNATIGLSVRVEQSTLRVDVADGSRAGARPRAVGASGGLGLMIVAALASRWGAGREGDRNVTWFELDLPVPGAPLRHSGRA